MYKYNTTQLLHTLLSLHGTTYFHFLLLLWSNFSEH